MVYGRRLSSASPLEGACAIYNIRLNVSFLRLKGDSNPYLPYGLLFKKALISLSYKLGYCCHCPTGIPILEQ